MHSAHYRTTTIFYHGEYIISDIRRDKIGQNISGYGDDDYTQLRIKEKDFDKIVEKMIADKSFKHGIKLDYKLTGPDSDTEENKTILVNSGEMVDFYLQKRKYFEISKLEKLTVNQLIKRYS